MDVFCDSSVADYIAKQCGIDRAGIIGFALLDISLEPTKVELADPVWWATQTAISPNVAIVIKNTRGEYNGGTPTEEEGFGRNSTIVTGADHEMVAEMMGLKENRDFWEGANRRKWKIAAVTNGDLLYFVEKPCNVYSKIVNPRDPKAAAFWSVSVKWQDFSNPVVVDAPEGIFE